ncbi:MAG TPA: phage shock protein operon transcriptional activator [Stellaceae bacterium]|nr:phage shock protein operon transcriptional activator [Stellaceae bacterium]
MLSHDPIVPPTPIGSSPAFRQMLDAVSLAAPLSRPVLVIGERGTGKELIAGRLHYLSRRWNQPFIKLNCAALPATLLEAELFGHEAGSFTGATRRRAGRFELAHRGSLFLDEIANAPLAVQEAILRVVEYGTFERVGGSETLSVDVRLIAATNIDLPAHAAAGRFRADLLDRLAFDVITIAPLRERPDDIEALAQHYGVSMSQELKRDVFLGFTRAALAQLRAYAWPGNARELKNVVERAVYRAADPRRPIDTIVFDPFASPWRPRGEPAPVERQPSERSPLEAAPREPYNLSEHIAGLEKSLLRQALDRNAHHQKRTAVHLGLGYHQLRNLLRKHGLIEKPGNDTETA